MTNFFRKIWLWVKRQAKKLLVILGFISIALAADNLPVNNITADKVAIQFEQATEIKSKYTLKESVLTREAKSDPKDRIVVEIGDNTPVAKTGLLGANATTTEFTPKLKISRWDEVSFSITPKDLDKIATKDKTLSFEGDKIKLETPKVDYELYELPIGADNPEGAFEYNVIEKEKQATDTTCFDIETQGLEFDYQPALNIEMALSTCTETDCGGSHRPENVVGSYVVYASEQKINWKGGKLYGTGQVGMFYRPKICDSNNWCVWGGLNIDTKTNQLCVKKPKDFYDKAVYPVKHSSGLTFGYNTMGGSYGGNWATNEAFGSFLNTTSTANGSVDSISVCTINCGTGNFKGLIINASTLSILTNGISSTTAGVLIGWATTTYINKPTVTNGTTYSPWVVWSAVGCNVYYNSGSSGDTKYELDNNYTTPTNPSSVTNSTNKYSIFASYTAGGASTTTAPIPSIIIIESIEDNLLKELLKNKS
jgi:hypothetical protein